MLRSSDMAPAPRTQFSHLKGDLQAGQAIDMPSLGQTPKDYSDDGGFFINRYWTFEVRSQRKRAVYPIQSNGRVLDTENDIASASDIIMRFLALNRDILTAARAV
ncbi:MAG: hypothetical protein J3Q66DRAFT_400774 [Benniella sp.]|nr:MAG: hypothetical protein J3Q66DRAFT_400774 [Benniella sp.]